MPRSYFAPRLGGDPELFFVSKKNGRVRGSEKVLELDVVSASGVTGHRPVGTNAIARDGVQVELHPEPQHCRAYLGDAYQICFKKLAEQLKGTEFDVSFEPVVKVTRQELQTLSEKSKVFGCDPSYNAHRNNEQSTVAVDATKYLVRTAGGHIHMGATFCVDKRERCVNVLDVVLGNTSVLLDRDPGQIERRKNYGRAGEYRKPSYGLEYRTLSNFWLRNYVLMSLVYGLARMAVNYVYSGQDEQLIARMDMGDVELAINNNDFDLAMANFDRFMSFCRDCDFIDPYCGNTVRLGSCNQIPYAWKDVFLYFVEKGLDYWFKGDILRHWLTMPEGHGHGWESFLSGAVRGDIAQSNRNAAFKSRVMSLQYHG